MTTSDPIADMLTRIRNANTAKHDTVDIPSSKMKLAIADILLKEGYIKKYDLVDEGNFKTIRIALKYGVDKDEKIITEYTPARTNFLRFLVDLVLQSSLQQTVLLLTRKPEKQALAAK